MELCLPSGSGRILRTAVFATVLGGALLGPTPAVDRSNPCLPCRLAGPSALSAQDLEDRVRTALARAPATGAVIAVVHADSLLLLQAFGDRDDEGGSPMELDNLFHLGSAGEMLLGAAAVQAGLDGRIRLDMPISGYAPDLPAGIGEATLAQLLTSTAGLDDSPLVGRLEGEEPEALPPEREVELLSDRVLITAPGMVRSTSRLSLLVAGHVLEAGLGDSFEGVFQALIGEPAEMVHTVFSTEEATARGGVPGYARGQNPERPFDPANPLDDALLAPHLRIWSSTPDLARLLGAWLGAIPLTETSAGPAKALHLASLPLVSDPTVPDDPPRLGFGWRIGEFEGRTELRASGGGPGHSALLRVIPDARLGVVILTNGSDASLLGVSSFILQQLLPSLDPDPNETGSVVPAHTDLFPVPVVPPPVGVEAPGPEHAGTYRNGSEILILVELGDGLGVEVGTAEPLEVRTHQGGRLTAHIADGRVAMRMRIVQDREDRVYLLLGGRAFLLENGP